MFQKENKNYKKVYIGISAGNWKQTFHNPIHSFSVTSLKQQTAFSKLEIERSFTTQIGRNISNSQIPTSFRNRCNLYLEKKF